MLDLQDLISEKAILAGICKYNSEAYLEIKDIVDRTCFSSQNAVIFSALEAIFEKDIQSKVDIPSIFNAAREIGLYECISDKGKQVAELFSVNVELSNLRSFAKKLRKFEKVKGLIGKFDETVTSLRGITGQETISEISTIAEKPIFDFLSDLLGDDHQVQQIGVGLDKYLENLDPNKEHKGIPIGLPKLEEAIGYLTHGVHVIAALMKTGKSGVALNAAVNTSAKFKIPVLFADTELKPEMGVYDRILARITQIDVNEIRFGEYKNDEKKIVLVNKAANMVKKIPLDYVNITGKTWEEFLQIIRRWIIGRVGYDEKGKIKPCLVVYDYIKMTDASSITVQISEHQQLGFLLSALHNISTEYLFPILAFAQLNREQDVASSMRIQWFCSSYSTMSRKPPECITEDGPQNGNIQIQPKYCRFGPGMPSNEYIHYDFNGKLCRFTELKTSTQIRREKEIQKMEDTSE